MKVYTALLCIFLVPSALLGGPIAVSNAGFESEALSPGGFSLTVPDWIGNGIGTFYPGNSHFTSGGATEGNNTVFLNTGSVSQVLGTALSLDTAYTLEVDVGNRLDNDFPSYQIQLLAGGILLEEDDGLLTPISGQFLTSTITFTSSALDPIGSALEIRLIHGPDSGQVNFDNVRLDAEAALVPEPSTYALILTGFLGLGWIQRKRRKAHNLV